MFKNRTLTVRMEKRNKDTDPDTSGTDDFDKRADAMLLRLEDLGIKMFIGICAYVLLDTYRQVKVAQANFPTE
jgi:hypothetical protein